MHHGFLFEHRLALRWIAGTPESSVLGDLKIHGKQQRHVASYCCSACGYLELYAEKDIS
jgi:predicted nucleic-acid-binding Zn-ribbon protein